MTAVPTTKEHAAATPGPASPPYGRTRLAAGLIGRSWLWFVVGCLLVTLVPMLFGWRPYVIQSGSMEPRINVGDVVLAAPVATADRDELLGRVTVFDSPEVPGKVITHRVVRFDGSRLVTKGDANQTVDSAKITMSSVRGLGRLLVRWVGLPMIWLRTGQWLWLLLFMASLLLAGFALVRDQEAEATEQIDPPDGPSGGVAGTQVAARRRRRLRPAWLLRTIVVLASTTLLAIPSGFAAFAATTADTTNSWTVQNYVYPTEVDNLAPYLYWRFEETGNANTAADSSGNGRTGDYNPSGSAPHVIRQTTGALVTDLPDSSVLLGSTSACINTKSTTAIAGPDTLTEIIWFNVGSSYTAGGKLIGFENPRTGEATPAAGGSYDRQLYMDGNGRIWFGVNNGGPVGISSGAGLNDGAWHMATATLGPAGMHLYIDGAPVAQNTSVTAGQASTGFWRVGCGNLSGWAPDWTGANAPPAATTASNYVFQGGLDEATIFTSELTASQIAFLYWTH